jgi:hypothetical protein
MVRDRQIRRGRSFTLFYTQPALHGAGYC